MKNGFLESERLKGGLDFRGAVMDINWENLPCTRRNFQTLY
jgi:hypothetical protein